MKIRPALLALLLLFSFACSDPIKNSTAEVAVEPGTALDTAPASPPPAPAPQEVKPTDALLGFYVGYFSRPEDDYTGEVFVGDGFSWNRSNKINVSIDRITDTLLVGHSVVAGNDRPFRGSIRPLPGGGYACEVKEPGDDSHDGKFTFTLRDNSLTGKWEAYRDVEIPKRVYTLTPREFVYQPEIMLQPTSAYVDWTKSISHKETYEVDGGVEEWVSEEFATATDEIYAVNASSRLLSRELVENLKKGDLTIIRNTIYARHGYSFKNRPLRVFFDAQEWYIPVHADIRQDFTEVEKENIKLLLRYEKNAAEYYDAFGRG